MQFFKKFFLLASFLLLLPAFGFAQNSNPIDLYFFEGQGCPHCAKMKSYLEGLKNDYPDLKVYDFEVYFNAENQALFRKMAEAYGTDTSGVPTIFIDNEVIVGENFEKVKNAVERCSKEVCVSPMDKIENFNGTSNANVSIDGYSSMPNKFNETVGWVIIGVLILAGIFLLFYFLKKKAKKL